MKTDKPRYMKYEEIREIAFRTYKSELNRSGNREYALSATIDKLQELGTEYKVQKRFIEGVKTEILFYHVYREELSLKPTTSNIDKYLHIDFVGTNPRTGERIFIDVTKAPELKLKKAANAEKWKKIYESLESLGLQGKYVIATYEPSNNSLELGPLFLPVHREGYPGFFIARLESLPVKDSFLSRLAVTVGVVYVVPRNGPDNHIYFESIDSEVVQEDIFEPYQPPTYDSLREAYHNRYFNNVDSEEQDFYNIPSFEEFVYNERYDIAYYYRKSLNVVLSAIFEYEYIVTDPRDGGGHWGHLMTWIHPIIQKRFKFTLGALFEEPGIWNLDFILTWW